MLTRFGKRLRTLRIEENQRLKDMADKLGVTAAYLSAVENGKRRVPDSWIATLTDEYGLSPEEERELQKLAYKNQFGKCQQFRNRISYVVCKTVQKSV